MGGLALELTTGLNPLLAIRIRFYLFLCSRNTVISEGQRKAKVWLPYSARGCTKALAARELDVAAYVDNQPHDRFLRGVH